ncbi:MAG: sensor histidine kinase [Romboutsia sp.]
MNKNRLVTLVRYISLIMMTLSIILSSIDFSNPLFILLMIIVINNQFRCFNLSENSTIYIMSILLDSSLVILLSSYINTFNIFFFIPIILDICVLKYKFKNLLLVLTTLSPIFIKSDLSIYSYFEIILMLSILSLLFIYIYNEDLEKINHQNIYDKLRISEDNLKKANTDLEIYLSSVEEIAILKERNRISREIHDSVGHSLSTTIIQLGAIKNLLKDNIPVQNLVHELREFVKESFLEVRNAVSTLKPAEYENYQNLFKIEELIKNFTKLTNVNVKMTISKNTWSLSSVQSMAVYRIIQESLSNSLRHGKATKIDIFISFNTDNLVLTISDNGVGCSNIKNGNGLSSISERISELNGKVQFNNTSDGFVIRANFPKKFNTIFN